MKNLKVLLLTSLFMVMGITTASTKNVEIVSKKYPVESFSSVKANTITDIVYTESEEVSVRADGEKELIEHLMIKVDDGVLTIEGDRELNSKSDVPLVIIISSPNLKSVETYGKGDLCMKGEVKSDLLIIKSFGIGSVNALNLQCEKVCVKYDGIGTMKLGGRTEHLEIFSSGIGKVDCKNLVAKTAIVKQRRLEK